MGVLSLGQKVPCQSESPEKLSETADLQEYVGAEGPHVLPGRDGAGGWCGKGRVVHGVVPRDS